MQKTRETGWEVNLGMVKFTGKTAKTRTVGVAGQVTVKVTYREDGYYDLPCPSMEHVHVWVQTTIEPILIRHVDLVDAPDIGRHDHYRLDSGLYIQDDMKARDPFLTEQLDYKVTPERDMCSLFLPEDVSEDWRDRELLIRCTDAAGNTYFSEEPFAIEPSPED